MSKEGCTGEKLKSSHFGSDARVASGTILYGDRFLGSATEICHNDTTLSSNKVPILTMAAKHKLPTPAINYVIETSIY